MTEFDFKGALEALKKLDPQHGMEVSQEVFEQQTLDRAVFVILHYEKLSALFSLAARVQSGELVVVPREADANMRCAFMECHPHYMASMEHRINEHYKALIQAAPKHDWSE